MKKLVNDSHLPISRGKVLKTQKQGVAYAGDKIFQKATYRHCPYCNTKNSKRNGTDSKERIRRKCTCGKSFIVDWRVWNLEKLFSELFEDGFRGCERHASIQYKQRIWQKLIEDGEIHEYINNYIMETTIDKSYSDDEKDKRIFIQACIKADQKDSYEISKIHDSWYFLLNVYNPDVSYTLENYCYILIRKHNFVFSKRQELQRPLLRCNQCGMSDLSTHGFNNNGRRRIKCNYCQKVSVIRVSHLISQTDLANFCNSYFQNFTRDQGLIQSITQTLQHNFTYISKSKEFDRLMVKQPVITYELKEEMMKAYVGAEVLRATRNLNHETWDALMSLFNFKDKIDTNGYLQLKNNTLYPLSPKDIYVFNRISNVENTQEYTLDNVFYEMAAHLHGEDTFYDWQSRSAAVFYQLEKQSINEIDI